VKILTQAFRFIVFSNIYISLCAATFAAKTFLLLYGNNGDIKVLALIFFATMFLYCFHRIYHRNNMLPEERKEERHKWIDKYKVLYYIFTGISLGISSIMMFYMPLRVWVLLVPVAVIGFGYSFPFIKTKTGFKRLRDLWWLKVFWIALAYAWLTTIIPVAYYSPVSKLFDPDVLLVFARSFLFVFALAIPFDIRDLPYDLRNGMKTLPIVLGIERTIRITMWALIAFVLLVMLQWQYYHLNAHIATALCISAFEAAIVIPLSKPGRPNLFYPLVIETSMILHWVLIYISVILPVSLS
jgi:4-hydroxybenzoate polyprenyltransferase